MRHKYANRAINRLTNGSNGLRQPDITRQTGQSRAKRHGGGVNALQMEWDTWNIWPLKLDINWTNRTWCLIPERLCVPDMGHLSDVTVITCLAIS